MNRIWIVEMLNPDYSSKEPVWEPTVGVALTRDQARHHSRGWKTHNPDDKFRVRCYVNRDKK